LLVEHTDEKIIFITNKIVKYEKYRNYLGITSDSTAEQGIWVPTLKINFIAIFEINAFNLYEKNKLCGIFFIKAILSPPRELSEANKGFWGTFALMRYFAICWRNVGSWPFFLLCNINPAVI